MSFALALETSGRVGSVALVRDGDILEEREFQHGLQNAARLLPIIDQLCRDYACKPADLREIFISIGPGSFTGLRIGVTLVKTLAFVTRAKIIAVPTVDSLVRNAPNHASEVVIVLDAKRDQIFTARFRRVGDGFAAEEPAHLDSLTEMLSRSPRPVHLIGDGIPYHRKFIPDDPQVVVTDEPLWRSRASVVAAIGMEMSVAGSGVVDPYVLTPLYIRLPEAEEKWNAIHGADPRIANQ